jgi:AcrR family transcriptional regulator
MLDRAPDRALSLSELAAELHVRTPSLYNHVAGLEALQRELALLAVEELRVRLTDAAVGRSGDDALHALAGAYRNFARERPGLYRQALRAPEPGDVEREAAAARVVDVVRRVLAGFGLRGDDAIHAVRAFRSAVHGFVSLETAGGFGLPLDLDESFRRLVEGVIRGLREADRP